MLAEIFDCPEDLVVGDEIELDNQVSGVTKYRVAEVMPVGWGTRTVRLVNISNPFDYYLNYDGAPIMHARWRRLNSNPVTPLVVVEVKYPGATCRRCKEHNAWAEGGPEWVCRSCRQDGFGVTWALYKDGSNVEESES